MSDNKLLPYPNKKENFLSNFFTKCKKHFTNIDIKNNYVAKPQITFIGATQTVTGSKYLLEYQDKKILVDCGLFQGLKNEKVKNRQELPVRPSKINAVILTHAHLDHSGYIPLIVKEGFKGPIYATQASFEFCKLILPDSGYLQEEDARFLSKKRIAQNENPEPLYTQEDATNSLKSFKIVRFNDKINISNDISFEILPAGHILGAGIVVLTMGDKKIVFSGDLGRTNDYMLYDPVKVKEADYILCESTYGDRKHVDADPKAELGEIINKTIARGGNIIIPAFAVGRTQSILYFIYKLKQEKVIPKIPVFVDSPMAIKITNLLDDFADEHKLTYEECQEIFDDTKFTSTVTQSKQIFEYKVPAVIISASGMMTGGRILHHVAHYGVSNLNTILLVGFQSNGTRGRDLQDGKKELKIHGQIVKINAEILKINNMSAHADSDELIDWLSGFEKKPTKLFVIHGELSSSNAFAERVKTELKWDALVPEYLQMQQLI